MKINCFKISLVGLFLSILLYILGFKILGFVLIIFFTIIQFNTLPYQQLKLRKVTMKLEGISTNHKVMILSDFHFQKDMTTLHPNLVNQSIEMILSEDPELIIFLGDYIQLAHQDIHMFTSAFEYICHKYKCIGILGNHDLKEGHKQYVISQLESIGMTMLIDKSFTFDGVNIYGVENYENDIDLSLPHLENTVLLVHTPSVLNDKYFTQSQNHIKAIF